MSLAEFKDLCIDANDPKTVGQFWSAALGLQLHHQDDASTTHLTGASTAETVWICRVPEPKTVKHRVHLDVYGTSVESFQDLGAAVIDGDSFPWVVMADPEGGEFCLFLRDEPPLFGLHEIVIDCADHAATAQWWADCIGGRYNEDERGFSFVSDIPHAPFQNLSFIPVPEAKELKNRIHIDVFGSDVNALLQAGATLLRAQDDEIGWSVLADPEGNEFCVFAPS